MGFQDLFKNIISMKKPEEHGNIKDGAEFIKPISEPPKEHNENKRSMASMLLGEGKFYFYKRYFP